MGKPKFDPSKPFTENSAKPKFDPSKPYQDTTSEQTSSVINEMHPDISFGSRALYKAFSNDPATGLKYLQRQHPNLQFKNEGGEVQAKRADESEWRKLDPSGLDLQDATDLAYDIPAGVVQGLATAGSGLLGAGFGGIGAIPAAMAGSAASGAALETARQGLGKFFGVNEEIKPGQIGTSAAIGAASPLAFGTGATGGQILKSSLAKNIPRELVEASQRGIPGRVMDFFGGGAGRAVLSLASGESKPIMKTAYDNLDAIKAAGNDPNIRIEPIKQILKQVPKELKKQTRAVGKEIGDFHTMIDEAAQVPGLVPYGTVTKQSPTLSREKVLEPFQELLVDLEQGYIGTPGEVKDLVQLKKIIDDEVKALPENLTAKQLEAYKDRLRGLAEKYGYNYGNTKSTVSATEGAGVLNSKIAHAFESARQNVNEIFYDKLESMGKGMGDKYLDRQEMYGLLKDMGKTAKKDFRDVKSTSNFLGRATKNPVDEQALMDLERLTGVDLTNAAKKEEAFRVYTKPSTEIRSIGGSTSTSRSIPLSTAGGLAASVGSAGSGDRYFWTMLGSALGSKLASPAAIRNYMIATKTLRDLPRTRAAQWTIPAIERMSTPRN